jgi:uncharacterized protein (DUF1697 family)
MAAVAARVKTSPSMLAGSAQAHVALLRGINVGGKNKLAMRELAGLFTKAGCTDVRTYIQSGNVIFNATSRVAESIAKLIETGVARRFGIRAPVITRSADELRVVVEGNPFLEMGADETALHVAFLAHRPEPREVAALDTNRSPPDAFVVRGREVYLNLPNGVARSRLTNAYFDSKLGTTSTQRNWRTVRKLLELAGAAR